jgi:outer membrane lipoprotein LolB
VALVRSPASTAAQEPLSSSPAVSAGAPADTITSTTQAEALQWHALGRVAIKTPTQGLTAQLDWQQAAAISTVHIQGLLGLGAVTIISSATHMTIIKAGNTTEYALDDPQLQAFLLQQLGTLLPLGSLRYWLRGGYDPTLPVSVDASGFMQQEWHVSVEPPQASGTAVHKLELTHERDRIRVVLDQWLE